MSRKLTIIKMNEEYTENFARLLLELKHIGTNSCSAKSSAFEKSAYSAPALNSNAFKTSAPKL